MAINLSGISLTADVTGGGGVSGGVTAKMKFIPVTTLPPADTARKNAVYLIPSKNATAKNKYDEYVVLQTENGYIWELFGQDVSVDLQSFATKAELNKKQDQLVNQQNIRSINNVPLLGPGNVNFEVFASAAEKKKVLDFVDNGATKTDLETLGQKVSEVESELYVDKEIELEFQPNGQNVLIKGNFADGEIQMFTRVDGKGDLELSYSNLGYYNEGWWVYELKDQKGNTVIPSNIFYDGKESRFEGVASKLEVEEKVSKVDSNVIAMNVVSRTIVIKHRGTGSIPPVPYGVAIDNYHVYDGRTVPVRFFINGVIETRIMQFHIFPYTNVSGKHRRVMIIGNPALALYHYQPPKGFVEGMDDGTEWGAIVMSEDGEDIDPNGSYFYGQYKLVRILSCIRAQLDEYYLNVPITVELCEFAYKKEIGEYPLATMSTPLEYAELKALVGYPKLPISGSNIVGTINQLWMKNYGEGKGGFLSFFPSKEAHPICDSTMYSQFDSLQLDGEEIYEPMVLPGRQVEYVAYFSRLTRNAFIHQTTLTTIELPASVNVIPAGAFMNCEMLKHVSSHSTITEVHSCAFQGDGVLYGFITSTLDYIGSRAFERCGALDNVTLKEGVTVGFAAFGVTRITRVTLKGSYWNINEFAFKGVKPGKLYCEVMPDRKTLNAFIGWMLHVNGTSIGPILPEQEGYYV